MITRGSEVDSGKVCEVPDRKYSGSLAVSAGALPGSIDPYESLKQAILTGEVAPGQPLVETALASSYNVSRTPIREALTRLAQDGLVERSDRGVVVRRRSPEEILDIYEVRTVLEATVGRLAAERRTPHDIRVFRRWLARAEEIPSTDPEAMVEANVGFHRAMWRASHNESLRDILERLILHLGRYPVTTLSYPGRWKTARAEHAALAEAVEARDGQAAYDVGLRHFTAARDIRLRLWEEEGEE